MSDDIFASSVFFRLVIGGDDLGRFHTCTGLAAQDRGGPRIILGELIQPLAVPHVEAAVSDVRDDEVPVGQERADDRRSHTQIVIVAFGKAIDAPVRQADGCLQAVRFVRQMRIDAVRP